MPNDLFDLPANKPCSNVKIFTDIPDTSIVESSVDVHKTFLDTIGRTSITLKARNLVDEFRDRQLILSYDLPLSSTLRKPLVVFGSMMGIFVATWAVGKIQMGFSKA